MPTQSLPVAQLVLLSALLLFLFILGATGDESRTGPTSCNTTIWAVRVYEGTSGVIMNSPPASVSLTLLSNSNPTYISYNAATKQLIANKSLEVKQTEDDVMFQCTSGSTAIQLTVTIKVLDVNNLGPVFKIAGVLKNSTTVSFEENKKGTLYPSSTSSPTILCDGQDKGNVNVLKLEIVRSVYSDHFQINDDGNNVNLKVIKDLDFEKSNSIPLTIRCFDRNKSGDLIGTADFLLTVSVINVPEKGRYEFNHATYSATLTLDEVAPGKQLTLSPAPLNATNAMADQPVQPTYGIFSIGNRPEDNDLFTINTQTGILSVAKNYSQPMSLTIRVKVSVLNDSTSQPGFADIKVEFKPPTGLRLEFASDSIRPIEIPESTKPNTILRTVQVNYKFVAYKPKKVTFSVETHKDVFGFAESALKLLRKLDYESNDRFFNVRIKASESNTAPITTVLKVTITDDNDNSPKFAQDKYNFDLNRKAKKNSLVGGVKATDGDRNTVLSFIITGDSSHAFKINRTTGSIYLISDGRALNKSSYTFVVQANDGANVAVTVVTVNIAGSGVNVSSANASTVAVSALGATIFLIIVVSVVGFFWFKRRRTSYNAEARRKKQMDSRPPGDSLYYSETGMTTLQENPVYGNDFDDGLDVGMFRGDRDVSEIELYDSGDVVGSTSHAGTMHSVMSNTLSSFQRGTSPMQNGHSIRLPNNMELVSADNAVYSEAVDEVTSAPRDELTIYY